MVNPYICYAIAFTLAIILYPLGWSDLYPPLSSTLIIFLICTLALHLLAGIRFLKHPVIRADLTKDHKGAIAVTGFLYLLWAAEFLHAGGIPLLQILMRRTYDYKTFGIPTLHVFIVTFSSFFTILLFQRFLLNRSSPLLFLFLLNLLAALLIYNRGMFLFNTSACVFLFVMHRGRITYRHAAVGVAGLVMISFLFGAMGSLRVSNESKVPYSNDGFLNTGSATLAFRNSGVPGEFFWSYVYTTSPLANLQQNITFNNPPRITGESFLKWFNNELLPDFISKRVNSYTGRTKEKIQTIPGPFNATTVYAGSYSYAGWWGILLMAIAILLIPILYVRILPPASPFFLSGLVIINTIYLFMIFDNTLRFTGLSFQIVYPILLNLGVDRIKWIRKVFL